MSIVLAKLLCGVGLAPGAIAAVAWTGALGALAFAALGYAVSGYAVSGLIGSTEAAQPVVQARTMPPWFLSGVLIPTQNVTGALRTIGKICPIEHPAASLHLASIHGSFGGSASVTDLLIDAGWGASGAIGAIARFRWLPSAAAV